MKLPKKTIIAVKKDFNLSLGASVSGVDSSGLVVTVEPTAPEQVDAGRGHIRIRHGAPVVGAQGPI